LLRLRTIASRLIERVAVPRNNRFSHGLSIIENTPKTALRSRIGGEI
jgi:hypothetical protein